MPALEGELVQLTGDFTCVGSLGVFSVTLAAALGDAPASNKMAYGPGKANISKNLKQAGSIWSFDHSKMFYIQR